MEYFIEWDNSDECYYIYRDEGGGHENPSVGALTIEWFEDGDGEEKAPKKVMDAIHLKIQEIEV